MALRDSIRRSFPIIRLAAGVLCSLALCPASGVQADENTLAAAGEQAIGVLGTTPGTLTITPRIEPPGTDLNGWEYLYLELRKTGIDHQTLVRLFTDRRMPAREPIYFGLNPKESRHLYRKHNTIVARRHALGFYRKNIETFKKAEQRFGVPQSVILSILQVETGCGGNTGSSRVLYQLARLAVAAEPENIEKNLARYPLSDRPGVQQQVTTRANYLRDTFLPHVVGAIRLAERLKIDPLELRGSSAGAVGNGQFLPGNVISLGVDGNGDSFVDPFADADSIMSVANFLKHSGWKSKGMTTRDKRAVIWHYNRSDAYIDTVLAMARALDPTIAAGGIVVEPRSKSVAGRGGKPAVSRASKSQNRLGSLKREGSTKVEPAGAAKKVSKSPT